MGALPALLGFSVPDAGQIRASGTLGGDLEGARQLWAGWLVGVLLIYGLLPRLLLAGFSLWRWRRGRAALKLDLNLPAYLVLRERLQPPSERLGISDAAPAQLHAPSAGAQLEGSAGAVLVAIELDGSRPWPPVCPRASPMPAFSTIARGADACSISSPVFHRRAWPSPAIPGARRIAAPWR